jgi:hypothetical protein
LDKNETSALVLASAASTPKSDIAVAGEEGLSSPLGLQKGYRLPDGRDFQGKSKKKKALTRLSPRLLRRDGGGR